MKISVTEAGGAAHRACPARRSRGEIILTRHGQPAAACSAPAKTALIGKARRKLLQRSAFPGASKASAGPDAARSHDFLYDENGLPK